MDKSTVLMLRMRPIAVSCHDDDDDDDDDDDGDDDCDKVVLVMKSVHEMLCEVDHLKWMQMNQSSQMKTTEVITSDKWFITIN